MDQLIEVKLSGIALDENEKPVLLLQNKSGVYLPIWIGVWEAEAIRVKLCNEPPNDPSMAYELMIKILDKAGPEITQVTIVDYVDTVYYAKITFLSWDGIHDIDSRPSDAIALALRAEAPIFVKREIFEKFPDQLLRETSSAPNEPWTESQNKRFLKLVEGIEF